eukprot:CAMPEP_0118959672 /NCGR_PEP_ID=MMETSP1169-20130426/63250_1 /TAXON_ID=36882 /ORGANISM="Pyramimonas obovata, Strain CCMP722" /LENGTH=408 /DNA_ID=CAMNT_0006907811 /DNA_START=629 /DNA_END=1852 /DNA_ORIENTATION=+
MQEESGELLPLPSQRVLMVTDFFYPNSGGVESHVYHLAQGLLSRGHKVVVMTHAYGERTGVRFMSRGLKVYYVPRLAFYSQDTFPTVFGNFRLFRNIVLREKITLIHGHQAFSTLMHEALFHARTMGYKTVFTDHSLFGFADGSSIHTNKVLEFTLADTPHIICVSHTSKENTVLRASVHPDRVSVIPNAVDSSRFQPDLSSRPQGPTVNIVVMSRLAYRKGVDLLIDLVPRVCARFPHVHFIIGGDGPKYPLVAEMLRTHRLEERVELLGHVPHADVARVLNRGQLFLNMSLTEAFCIALLEAASCGLLVVSTRVGGVPEVLPAHMLLLAPPCAEALEGAVSEALDRLPHVDPLQLHHEVKAMYSWEDTTKRTEVVYARALRSTGDSTLARLQRFYRCGPWAGKIFC